MERPDPFFSNFFDPNFFKKQKLAQVKPLRYFTEKYKTRNESMAYAYLSGNYTFSQVGEYFGVSYATVS